jgi:AcrR family transcriptional regulator
MVVLMVLMVLMVIVTSAFMLAEEVDMDSENATDGRRLPPGLALSWGVEPEKSRGPKPAFSVGQIVAASVELADRDGAAAVSLPRIAKNVGLSTTALYRYVRSKDELVVLMVDAAWGPPPAKIGRTRTWRTGAAAWTRGMIDQLAVHPWILDMPVQGAPLTPNTLRWLEAFLGVMARSGLDHGECLGCALLLDGFARSYAGRDPAAVEFGLSRILDGIGVRVSGR